MSTIAKLSMLLVLSISGAAPLMAQDASSAGDTVEQSRPDAFYCGERKLGQWFYCDKPRAAGGAGKPAPLPSAR